MRRSAVVVTLGLTGVVLAAGVATAGWLVTGYGSATVQASNPRLDVTGGEVQNAYPGGTVPTQLTVRNVNTFPVDFGTVDFDSVTVDPDHSGCPASVLSVDWTNPHTLVLPNEQRAFDIGVAMSPSAPPACMGASFQVVYRASGAVGTTTP